MNSHEQRLAITNIADERDQLRIELEKARAETAKLCGLLREWWESSKLSCGDGGYLAWYDSFTVRVRAVLANEPPTTQIQRVPDGTPYVRDIDAPCRYFEPGTPHGTTGTGHECYGDGHYLCKECFNKSPDPDEEPQEA